MSVVAVAVIGGLLALDSVSVAQTMVSRPLVTGFLIGWVLGDPVTGLTVGALLELYLLVAVPTGGGRFPEGSVAAAVGAALAVTVPGPIGVAAGVALGLVWGWVGGVTQSWMRERNGARAVLAEEGTVTEARVARSIGVGVVADFLRAAALCGVGAALGVHFVTPVLLPVAAAAWPDAVVGPVLLGGGAVSAGILLRNAVRGPVDWVLAGIAAAVGVWIAGGVG